MTPQTSTERPTVRYTLTCPAWCAVDHHQPTDSGLHELSFPVPGLDDGDPTVVLSQAASEAAGIDVYLPHASLTGRQALDLAEALANAAEALLPERQAVRQVEVVQVLPDLVALRDTQGGLRTVGSPAAPGIRPWTGPVRAVLLVSRRDGLVLYALAGSTADLLAAAELAIEDPSSAAWKWAVGEWSAELGAAGEAIRATAAPATA